MDRLYSTPRMCAPNLARPESCRAVESQPSPPGLRKPVRGGGGVESARKHWLIR